jgi:hypothetical protein
MNVATRTKWDEFLDAYLDFVANPRPDREEVLARLGRELQDLDPKFSYDDFERKIERDPEPADPA